jgi:hypothetical protein
LWTPISIISFAGTIAKLEAFKGSWVGNILAGKYRFEKIRVMVGMEEMEGKVIVVAAMHLDLRGIALRLLFCPKCGPAKP